ncbi:hypothetical protein OG500_34815 [Kitasatospora sp. NBC_01250]|uniref:hypothetical protein n=1 Tax=Kitasatospora sp. NBC_01250 TaxID=2903571 RepID=UPI002E33D00C|nr:hypothetical protein [Kitasatospora sp. NBC_01250]
MSGSGDSLLAEQTGIGDWDFGDFPYGLEPLAMPAAGHSRATGATPPATLSCDRDLTLLQLRFLADGRPLDLPESTQERSADQLFWFRWITGHQVTFLIWHLMGRLIEQAGPQQEPEPAAFARLEAYAYGYCAMLLYTGSCPLDLYQDLIRPRMFLQHRSFSGAWASDYAPVRGLFRGRGLARGSTPQAARLARAVETNKVIHDGIAARLVPGGKSLLQQAMLGPAVRPSERTALLYDNFFMTLRAPVDEDAITSQLLRRLRAVALDVAANGLYPLGLGGGELPEELRRAEVTACEERVGLTLHEVGAACVADPLPYP